MTENKTKNIYILRHVSGAGSSTLAKTLESSFAEMSCIIVCADDFMVDENDNYDN